MTSSPLVEKLLQAERTLVELGTAGRSKTTRLTDDRRDHLVHDVLNDVRRALQLAREEPIVPRQGFSSFEGEGLGKHKSIVERHESFGVISISKPSGGRMRLVGAMTDSLPTCVELRVHAARRDIDTHLQTEHYFQEGPPLLVVRLSTYQWAELICNMMGTPIPCTLECLQGVNLDDVPGEVKTPLEQISKNARAEMLETQTDQEQDFYDAIDGIVAQLPTLKLSKKKEDELKAGLQGLRKFVTAPKAAAAWASQRLAEDTEKLGALAKVEMAAAFQSLLVQAGLGAIAGRLEEAVSLQLEKGDASDD